MHISIGTTRPLSTQSGHSGLDFSAGLTGGVMKTVSQLLESKSRGLCTIGPDASVFDALKLMAERNIGALLVVENAKLVGILSERDYARQVVLHAKSEHEPPL